jgi:hypothetical protein
LYPLGVHSYPSHLDNIPKIAVEGPIIMLNETEIIDGRRCLEAMHSRDGKEFNLSQAQLLIGLNTYHSFR